MASVLIIDADEGFAGQLSDALSSRGLDVQITPDGKAGLDLARINIPDAIVLCVELPRMSGYSICAKLKKDGVLKTVPLIITSAEATQETFEHHKKLKTRAEEYLKKPFDPEDLLALLHGYVSVAIGRGAPAPVSEELQIDESQPETLSDEEVFDASEGNGMASFDQELAHLQSQRLPPPDLGGSAALHESFDEEEAMTTVGTSPRETVDHTAELEKLRLQVAAEKDAKAKAERERDVAVANEKAAAAQLQKMSSSQPPTAASSGREVLELKKELNAKDREFLDLREQLQRKDKLSLELRDKEMDLESKVVEAEEARAQTDRLLADAEGRLAAAAARAEELERSSQVALNELNNQLSVANSNAAELDNAVQSLEQELSSARGQSAELSSKCSSLESQLGKIERDLANSRADASRLREQLGAAQANVKDLNGQVVDLRGSLDSANDEIKNLKTSLEETEDRLSRAYKKIREDEEVKSKAKKALEIASALLVEAGFAADGDPPDEVVA